MNALQESVGEFLAAGKIAVVGVSRDPRHVGNAIYRKLRAKGVPVVAVNPQAPKVEGDPCYPDVASIPGGVEAVVVATPPATADAIVHECHEAGIRRVWLHGSFGSSSVPAGAVAFCREHGIRVIAGACPMMFVEPVDIGHRCARTVLGWIGRLPKGA